MRDHHGFPIPARLLPLHPAPWSLSDAECGARRQERGDYVSANPRANFVLEVMRGYQYRPADERARIDAIIKATAPMEVLKAENETLRARVRELEAKET